MAISMAVAPFQSLRYGCKRSVLQTHNSNSARCGAPSVEEGGVRRGPSCSELCGGPEKCFSAWLLPARSRRFDRYVSIEFDSE